MNFRETAIESGAGRALYAGSQLLRGAFRADPFLREAALLRAWRTSDSWWVRAPGWRYLRRNLTHGGRTVPIASNPFLRAYAASDAAERARAASRSRTVNDRVRMREPRPAESETRQGSLMVLKPRNDETGEKGVLIVKYSEAIEALPAMFDLERLVQRYAVVLEPSWWGYQDAALFNYVGAGADVVVQAQAGSDYAFLRTYGLSLSPVRVGAGDWIDPAFFTPTPGPARFDVVMVSSWNPFKRHTDLFAAMSKVKSRYGRTLSAALIGYPNGWTVDDIRTAMVPYGVADQCTIFNAIPQSEVARIVGSSRAYVLLSRREGANKAMYEAMFCNTPVVAPADHRGINHDHLNGMTGLAFQRGRLAEALLTVVSSSDKFRPRAWAEQNTGFMNATHRVDEALRNVTVERGGLWTRSIVPKKNQPNLTYANDGDRLALEDEYPRLEEFLRP